jgi:hypothetical protein
MTTIMPKMKDVSKAAEPEIADVEKVNDLISKTTISNDSQMQTATTWIAEIKEKYETVEEKRKSFVDPLRGVIEEINAFFKPALDGLKSAEMILKQKIADHVQSTFAKRDELISKVESTSGNEARSALVKQAEALVPAKIDGMSIRESWGGEITDMNKLVQWAIDNRRNELLIVDEKALVALTKAAGRDPQIPGWKAVIKRSVAVTTGKVKK